jgi:hypothetical protein
MANEFGESSNIKMFFLQLYVALLYLFVHPSITHCILYAHCSLSSRSLSKYIFLKLWLKLFKMLDQITVLQDIDQEDPVDFYQLSK